MENISVENNGIIYKQKFRLLSMNGLVNDLQKDGFVSNRNQLIYMFFIVQSFFVQVFSFKSERFPYNYQAIYKYIGLLFSLVILFFIYKIYSKIKNSASKNISQKLIAVMFVANARIMLFIYFPILIIFSYARIKFGSAEQAIIARFVFHIILYYLIRIAVLMVTYKKLVEIDHYCKNEEKKQVIV